MVAFQNSPLILSLHKQEERLNLQLFKNMIVKSVDNMTCPYLFSHSNSPTKDCKMMLLSLSFMLSDEYEHHA